MRPSFAASRASGRGGWERASVAVCSMRTARFDEDISIFLLVKSPDWRRRERYQQPFRAASRIRLTLAIPFGVLVDRDSEKEKPPPVSRRGSSIYKSTVNVGLFEAFRLLTCPCRPFRPCRPAH